MRKVLKYPHPTLRSRADEVTDITDNIHIIWNDMIAVMEAMPGVGLAAPQIGILQRLAVVDASQERGKAIRMANPEILHTSIKFEDGDEASPCLPGVSAKIKRPRGITVRYMDENGQIVEKDMVGLWARSTLHQIDHLNGKMYFNNLSNLKRQILLRKAAKK